MSIATVGLVAFALNAQEQRQGPPRPDAQIEAMKQMASLAGNWKGEGWIDFGGRRVPFSGGERVQSKLAGTAMLVEGSFFARIGEKEVPVHTTLGVISFDPATKKYRFNTWLATGTSGQHEIELIDGGWQWQLSGPRGRVRYVVKMSADEWFETGERSADGTSWTQFFEMRLKRAAAEECH